jgi:valyl-tRNA synthetase
LPFTNAAISGFVFDPDRKKLSKSAGNSSDDPNAVIAEFGSDAVRYWAAGGRPGMDVAFDRNQLKVGRRLAIKLLNASKFVLSFGEPSESATPTEPLDLALLAHLGDVIREATAAFESYDYTRALERTEPFFWAFCDDYVELVKSRAYAGDASALVTLRTALSVLLRLFAPFLAFVTDEAWSWWHDGSVHREPWPAPSDIGIDLDATASDRSVFDIAAAVLAEVRKAKTTAKKSLRADVERAVVTGSDAQVAALEAARHDVIEAGRIATLEVGPGDELTVDVLLAG